MLPFLALTAFLRLVTSDICVASLRLHHEPILLAAVTIDGLFGRHFAYGVRVRGVLAWRKAGFEFQVRALFACGKVEVFIAQSECLASVVYCNDDHRYVHVILASILDAHGSSDVSHGDVWAYRPAHSQRSTL